ncbi:MAG TPA: hypothetical protein VEO54_13080 [Thermoanaerobaculia bacterium]|nr:hypothetical protein [Thermoanaerobaculia bacterium]
MTKNGRAHAIGWAAVIIGALTLLRFAKGAGDPPYGVDASYYFQLARHVMNGEGLVTTVSLYHEGWVAPAKTTIYPLWPLLLGYAGRAIGLARAADLLPRVLYVVDLVLLYLLAMRIATRFGGLRLGRQWWLPDSAHWVVAVFGVAPRFFGATTHPYTEGLGFAMAFASFLALERFERTRGLVPAALSGLFAGLAFLTRTQLIGVAIGCFLALAWLAVRDRSARLGTLVWSLAAVAAIAPWLLFLGFVPVLMENDLPRVALPHFAGWSELPTRTAWLQQRASSLGVMFDPSNELSYVQSFGVVAFLVPLAALAALMWHGRMWRGLQPADSGGLKPAPHLLTNAVLLAGVFFFFSLMLYHSEVWTPWLFGWRHGLPFILLIALTVPWLAARAGRFAPAIALVLLVSVATSARGVLAFVQSPDTDFTPAETELVAWLNARPVSAITTNAQILGSMTDAPLYWTYCDASGESTRAMLAKMPITHVILYEREARCRFIVEADPLRLVQAFDGPGGRIFVLQPLRR